MQEARRNDAPARLRARGNSFRYRNKFPRPPGQGASLIERLATGISGSQTGGQSVLDVSLPELVTQGGSFGQWPLNLPPAGSQTFVTLNVPYRYALCRFA